VPSVLRLLLDLDGEETPLPEHLRAFAADLFERGHEGDHHRLAKPYSVKRFAELESGRFELDFGVVDDRWLARAAGGRVHSVFLGPLRGVLSDMVLVRRIGWSDLLVDADVRRIRIAVSSPVVFRSSGNGQHDSPTPKLVFGYLRRRWRLFDPATVPDVGFGGIEWSIALPGRFETVSGPGRFVDGRRRARLFRAYVGPMEIDIGSATSDERCALASLARLVEFTGIGAFTTAGFGSVECVSWSEGVTQG
jgi:hypothetical protein